MTAKTPETGGFDGYYDANGIERARIGDLGNGDYGLVVRDPTGSTVIVDGTSDMFRITATGTLNLVAPDAAITSTNVTLTALGVLPVVPAFLTYVKTNSGETRTIAQRVNQPSSVFVAITSGGAVTTRAVNVADAVFDGYADLDGSSNLRVWFTGHNRSGSSITADLRYYVMEQVAI